MSSHKLEPHLAIFHQTLKMNKENGILNEDTTTLMASGLHLEVKIYMGYFFHFTEAVTDKGAPL